MRLPLRIASLLLSSILAGCSSHILEDIGEISAPHDCAETTKVFNTFSMRAKSTSWKGAKSDPSATLTLELAFSNDKKWPVALSNSGAGVLYAVEFSLQGPKGTNYKPIETTGIASPGEARKPKEARDLPFFGEPQKRRAKPAAVITPPKIERVRNVNFQIKPGETEEGKLVFQAPRDNYLLTIERKFSGKPVAGAPADHIAVCKISGGESAAISPTGLRFVSGVY